MKVWIVYLVAAAIGLAVPVLVLAVARGAPAGSDPRFVGFAIVVAMGAIGAFLAMAEPRHWWQLALVATGPLVLLGVAMFGALASLGEYFWIWLWVSLGSMAAALGAAFAVRRVKAA